MSNSIHAYTVSRRDAPELCMLAPPEEGRGECRVLDAPAVSRAKVVESTRGIHRGFTGLTRHSRTRWF